MSVGRVADVGGRKIYVQCTEPHARQNRKIIRSRVGRKNCIIGPGEGENGWCMFNGLFYVHFANASQASVKRVAGWRHESTCGDRMEMDFFCCCSYAVFALALHTAELMWEIKWKKMRAGKVFVFAARCVFFSCWSRIPEMQFLMSSQSFFMLHSAMHKFSRVRICLIYSLEWCCTQVPLS